MLPDFIFFFLGLNMGILTNRRACLVLLIFRLLLLNNSVARILFTQIMLSGFSTGFLEREFLPIIFIENTYHLLSVGREFFFLPFNYFESKCVVMGAIIVV